MKLTHWPKKKSKRELETILRWMIINAQVAKFVEWNQSSVKGKCIEFNAYIKKERSKINDISF